jgi:hypothetical protein
MCAAHGTQWELFLENLENNFFLSCDLIRKIGWGME